MLAYALEHRPITKELDTVCQDHGKYRTKVHSLKSLLSKFRDIESKDRLDLPLSLKRNGCLPMIVYTK